MRIFKTTWFNRFARKNGIEDEALIAPVNDLEANVFDAGLGSGVYKKRLSREKGNQAVIGQSSVFGRMIEHSLYLAFPSLSKVT